MTNIVECNAPLCSTDRTIFAEGILTCHERKSTGAKNKMNDGQIPVSCLGYRVLANCHTVLGLEIEDMSHMKFEDLGLHCSTV